MPGVTRAVLNPATGKLTVEGEVDLAAIRREGLKENYKIIPVEEQEEQTQAGTGIKINSELLRTAVSAVALLAAYIGKKTGMSTHIYVPLFLLAMVTGGWGNFRKACYSLRRLNFNMSVLMSIAVMGAVAIGELEEGAVVSFLYSVSEMLESWTMERARQSIRRLMDIAPKTARIKKPWGEADVPVDEINIDDIMVIRPGEKIAMDGVIIKGESAVNEAAVTGESIPAEKGPGDEVYAGTLNIHGSLEVKVTKLVQDTTLAKIIHLVEEAQTRRAPAQAFVDRFAAVYTPIVIMLAGTVALVPPLFLGYEWRPWLYRGLALLVVSCPCALVVSTPAAIVSAIGNAARNGVLIKGGIYLEEAGSLKVVAFDKTGTLTRGEPVVTDVIPVGTESETEVLRKAASVEKRSEHPLAIAIVKAAEARGIKIMPVEGFAAFTGRGARGFVGGETIFIGSIKFFEERGIETGGITEDVKRLQEEGKTAILVGTESGIIGIIAVADEIRESSKNTVASLKRAGIERTVMLTGDNEATAKAVAARAGVDEFFAELLPQDKVRALEDLIKKYGKVAMVGDGINDAPALAAATVGIAMGGTGTDTALETADIVLMTDDLTKVAFTVRLSRAALQVIRQNITLSLVIKVLAVAAVFPGWLTLWLAIMADMGVTLLVTLNGIRLLKIRKL
ncbi:Cd2+/Zn2+-exporting ATPase [Thermosediminibacter litoriperuensis]|uniref:Cd(2+)-exporting ATPase n=2 Tax=Thermosediminibacter litoriperuensis TaxID=291989 RepID=A0A5S5AZD6_9FIRM|nr:Cd2+/Zn2+-exporting ATPase [Thermosediminibacter litoriperuensis]